MKHWRGHIKRTTRRHEPTPTFEAAKRIVLAQIDAETEPSHQKERIMIAYEAGVLAPDEAFDLVQKYGLREA